MTNVKFLKAELTKRPQATKIGNLKTGTLWDVRKVVDFSDSTCYVAQRYNINTGKTSGKKYDIWLEK